MTKAFTFDKRKAGRLSLRGVPMRELSVDDCQRLSPQLIVSIEAAPMFTATAEGKKLVKAAQGALEASVAPAETKADTNTNGGSE